MREICELCGANPARNHLCEIVFGKQTSLDLCDDCFRARPNAGGLDMPILDGTQQCYYCEEPAQSGGMNQEWEQSVRGQRFHFTCLRCADLFRRFFVEWLSDLPKGLSQDQQMEALTAAVAESDKRVRDALES